MGDDENIEPNNYINNLPTYEERLKTRVESENEPVDVRDCVKCAILCAGELLQQFTEEHPADNRPAETINVVRAWFDSPTPDNQQRVMNAMDNGYEWANQYAAPARRAVQAAWQAANTACLAAQVEEEENAVARAQNEANRLREQAEHWVDGPEATAEYARRTENVLAQARAALARAEQEQMYRRRRREDVERLEQQVGNAQADTRRAAQDWENYRTAQTEVDNAQNRRTQAANEVRNAARAAVLLTRE